MEKISEFIYTKIVCEKPTVNELLASVAKKFQSDLAISDVTFIKRKYSENIASLWERECEEELSKIITDGEIDGRKITQMIKILESEDIRKVKSIFNNRSLDLIESETDHENFHFSCKKILNVLKKKVKSANKNLRRDLEFFEALILVLRNFFPYHDEFVDEILMLNDFVRKKISLYDVAKRVSEFNHENEYFNKLKVKAVNYPSETSILEDYIRDEIKNYIAKVEVNSNNKIVEIKKKFLTSSDIIKHYVNENEVHIICDILHINDDLPESFRGKDIAIYANNIHIHKASKWNLSGVNSKSAYSSNAGQTLGKGNDGNDGYAGESGGNICVECKSITNASDWTIISNGGNGSDGQNGGDGTDGKDGKDASTNDFKINDADLKISFKRVNFDQIVNSVDMINRLTYKCGYKRFHDGEFVKDLWIHKVPTNTWALLFVKGSDGEIGKSGGLAGRGGEGGISGEISIKTLENYSSRDVRKSINIRGSEGKNGFAGHNGLNGKDGRDLGCFDSSWSNEYVTIGDDSYDKYEIKYSKSHKKHSVWHEDEKAYAYMSHKLAVSTTIQINRQRNEAKTDKALQAHAKASKKSPILMQNIKMKHSSYLKTSDENMRSIADKYGCVSTDITTKSCATSVANIRIVYQVHYDKSETIISKSKKVEIEKLKFKEIEAKIKKGISVIELIGILEKNEFNVEDLKSFKTLLINDTSIVESKSPNQIINTGIFSQAVEKFKNFKNSKRNKFVKYFDEIRDKNDNHESEFIDYLSQNEPFFVYNFFKIFAQENFNREDIKIMISEKLRLRQFEDAFVPLFNSEFNEKCNMPTDAEKLIPYLNETDEFENNFRDLFIKNSNENKDGRRKVFARYTSTTINKSTLKGENNQIIHCLTSIFQSLIYYQDELPEIKNTLMSFREMFEKKLNIKITSKEISLDEKKLRDGFKIVSDFFAKDEIQTFVRENITKNGLFSPIYRKLIAYEFGVNIKIFVRNIQQSFVQIENHNKSAVEQVFLLMSNEKFTKLKFNMEKYKTFYIMEKITIDCVEKFANFQKSDDVILQYKLSQADKFTFVNLFDVETCLIDQDNLIELILRKFDENQFELDELRSYLKCISKDNEISILKAINVRFYNESVELNSTEFTTIIMTILSLISQHEYLIKYFTFLLLSHSNSEWLTELILLSIERKTVSTVSRDDKKLWRELLNDVKYKKILVLFLRKISEIEDDMSKDDFCKIINFLKYLTMANYQHLLKIELKLWQYEMTTEYWMHKLKSIMPEVDENDLKLKEILNKLQSKYNKEVLRKFIEILSSKTLDAVNKFNIIEFLTKFVIDEWIFNDEVMEILMQNNFCDWMTKLMTQYDVKEKQRSVSQIIHLVTVNSETSPFIHDNMNDISDQANKIIETSTLFIDRLRKKVKEDDDGDDDDYVSFVCKSIEEWTKKLKPNKEKLNLIEAMAHIITAFQCFSKNNVMLRHTQIISILTLWNDDENMNGTLIQIGTGEGKTFVAIALAILKVLDGQNVDIITSSSVLAERDANSDQNRKIFETFGITVDHNCYEDAEKRKAAYKNSNVIYGVLNNFQRDYLLTEFYDQNFLSNHHFRNVIVDEVDSMLLDKGNNILYLSQDLPDIDEIESVFTFIWQWINQTTDNMNEMREILKTSNVRKILLDNAYGLIEEALIKRMLPAAESSFSDSKNIMWNLQSNNIIDDEGVIILEHFDHNKIQNALTNCCSQEVANKIKFIFREKIESEKQIKIPKYLKKFVLLHLNKWIENAVRALSMENNNQFTIDRERSGTISNFEPNVIIFDQDTGTDQSSSQWDEGLHQFLQLKYGCKLSLTSLKSVFISNVSYFKMYKKLYGLSGTLGAMQERKKLEKLYELNYLTIPSYLPKRFFESESIMTRNCEDWLEEIKKEVLSIFDKNRSVLIICETIKNLEIIRNKIRDDIGTDVYVYQRDYEKFIVNELQTKKLILSTNLAGRGTDIPLSSELKSAGGLHVILTYLAANIRIENQAFGRASRAGDDGTGRLIVWSTSDDHISMQKQMRDYNESVRLEKISAYYENFISVEESFFEEFRLTFKNYSSLLDEQLPNLLFSLWNKTKDIITDSIKNECNELKEILLENFKIKWAFWLDENSMLLEDWENVENKSIISSSFKNFLSLFEHVDYKKVEFHPISRLKVFKWFVKNERLEEAKEVLHNDFQDDSIAYNYYSICINLMINQRKNNYEHRDLSESKQSLKVCLNHLNNRDHLRSVRNYTMNAIKEKFKSTLIPIEAYKKQQNSIAEFERIFMNNIQELLGKCVTPQTFHSTLVSNELIINEIYESLVNQNFISDIKISSVLIDKNIEKIAQKYQISTNELHNFLKKEQNTSFKSFDDLSEKLKSATKFPSREFFWKCLLKSKILTNEEEFAVIDLMTLKNIDPSEVEHFNEIFKNVKLRALTADKRTQIYMDSINEDNETLKNESNMIAVPLNIFKLRLSNNKYNHFVKHDCIKIHKRANFDFYKYNIFININTRLNDFDQISVNDFKTIIADPSVIIKSLKEQRILNENHQLNYENLKNINLGENFVYETQICDLISRKFAFRIALEILAMKINENIECKSFIKNQIIHLHSQPHLLIIHDLIEYSIIDGSKVNSSKVDEMKKLSIFRKFLSPEKVSSILAEANILCDIELIKELKSKLLIDDLPTYIINKYKESSVGKLITTVTENEKCKKAMFVGKLVLDHGVSISIPQAKELKNIVIKIDSAINEDESLKKLIDSEPIKLIRTQLEKGPFVINNFNVNEMNLSQDYSHIEKTIRLLLQNRRIIVENKDYFINRFKQSAMPLRDESFEHPEFVFESIEEVCNQNDVDKLNFMKLKGLDLILKIKEKKWTRAYFIRLTVVMMAGVIQIAIGVAITILLKGIGTNIGQSFISQGIGDIIFATNTVKTGHFRWSDYGKHKMISTIISVSIFGATMNLSKMNMFQNYFAITDSTFGEKIAGKGFANMSGWTLLKQSNIISQIAKKEMWTAFYKNVSTNSIKAISIAGVSMGVDKFVEQQLGMITLSISSYIVDKIQTDFNTHKVTKTIDELLKFYTIEEVENIIDAKFEKILAESEYYRQMATEVGDKTDQIIQSGNGIGKIITTFSTITAKTVAIGSMALFISNILDELNFELYNQIQRTPEEQKVSKPTDDEIFKFKLKVSQNIQKQLAEQMKTVVNRNIISPTLNYAANLALSKAASEAIDVYKSIKSTKDEIKFSDDAKKIEEELGKLNKKESLTESELQEKQFVENRALEILRNTTNPLVYAQLSRLDIPLTNIDVESAAILISSKLNKNVKIVIEHEGIEHTFGNGEEVIHINYANSKHSFNKDYLFNTLAKTFPELKGHFDSQSFRYKIAETMKTNDEMKTYIADTRKKFFHDIGFYGRNSRH